MQLDVQAVYLVMVMHCKSEDPFSFDVSGCVEHYSDLRLIVHVAAEK